MIMRPRYVAALVLVLMMTPVRALGASREATIKAELDSLHAAKEELAGKLVHIERSIAALSDELKGIQSLRDSLVSLAVRDEVDTLHVQTIERVNVWMGPEVTAEALGVLPAGSTITAFGISLGKLKILYGSKIGYVGLSCLSREDRNEPVVEKWQEIDDQTQKEESEARKARLRAEADHVQLEERQKAAEAKRAAEAARQAAAAADRAAEERARQQAEERRTRLVNRYGFQTAERMMQGEIWIGMTSEMALESCGPPNHVNRTVTIGKVSEQWVYAREYLYFDNGVLTGWQEDR